MEICGVSMMVYIPSCLAQHSRTSAGNETTKLDPAVQPHSILRFKGGNLRDIVDCVLLDAFRVDL